MKNTTQDPSKCHTSSAKSVKESGGNAQEHERLIEKKNEEVQGQSKISVAKIKGAPAVQSKPPGKHGGIGGQTG
ncbi:hypothetical protein HAX54_053244 [Datura stramonium]|uniref:Uncharacterized protein n=1 Tax=Datura stramonium TaxID=4076 RepID=A0ABS8T035_DATST|nr:hypothetical protein [Datura stramonium]